MNLVVVVLAVVAAVPIGAFLNVVIERVPGRVPLRSEVDPEADVPVPAITRWGAVPVHPWILHRGDRSTLSRRWLWVELTTVAVFAVVAARYGDESSVVPLLTLAAGLVAVTYVDLEHLRIPDRITFPLLGLVGLGIVIVSLERDAEANLRAAALGSVVYFVLLLVPHLISPRGMGFGDVKLALVMGLVLGWVGYDPRAAAAGPVRLVLYALILGCIFGVAFGLVHAGATGRRGEFPFGPALALGCLVVILYAPQLRY
ncbi:MAG: A24 family peptidase [Actinomycetota bacterium]|nr:A24 family peptidase [Actinomycetota bacterium]